jgi:hypothetical protein
MSEGIARESSYGRLTQLMPQHTDAIQEGQEKIDAALDPILDADRTRLEAARDAAANTVTELMDGLVARIVHDLGPSADSDSSVKAVLYNPNDEDRIAITIRRAALARDQPASEPQGQSRRRFFGKHHAVATQPERIWTPEAIDLVPLNSDGPKLWMPARLRAGGVRSDLTVGHVARFETMQSSALAAIESHWDKEVSVGFQESHTRAKLADDQIEDMPPPDTSAYQSREHRQLSPEARREIAEILRPVIYDAYSTPGEGGFGSFISTRPAVGLLTGLTLSAAITEGARDEVTASLWRNSIHRRAWLARWGNPYQEALLEPLSEDVVGYVTHVEEELAEADKLIVLLQTLQDYQRLSAES